ncbi:MAG TPA: hypothetical protein PKK26_12625 [Candidatus Wallbacteria bacterium]|nr:hypothetical protein [Candidatus Wallbacteria bacterium]
MTDVVKQNLVVYSGTTDWDYEFDVPGILVNGTAYLSLHGVTDASGNNPTLSTYILPIDTTGIPPTVSNATISLSTASNTINFSWNAASDDITPAANLSYSIYCTIENNLFNSVADCKANGTYVAGTTGTTTKSITDTSNLKSNTLYYFNIIVKDAGGNESIYSTANITSPAFLGTTANPYQITKIDHLVKIGTETDGWSYTKAYILMNDLDLNSDSDYIDVSKKSTYTSGEGWVPIGGNGNSGSAFKGSFDGNGKVIKNLMFNKPENLTNAYISRIIQHYRFQRFFRHC